MQSRKRKAVPQHLLMDEPKQGWWHKISHWLFGSSSHTLRREQLISLQPSRVFQFLIDTSYIERLALPSLKLQLLRPQPTYLHGGQVLHYQWRFFGKSWQMKTVIEQSSAPSILEEVQTSGPFSSLKYLRRLRIASGGTWIIDDLKYELPWGCFGRLMNRLFIQRKIEKFFDHRQQLTIDYLISDAAQAAQTSARRSSRSQINRPEEQPESHTAQ